MSAWLRAVWDQAPLWTSPPCEAWRKEFEWERDRWRKVPGVVIRSGKPGTKNAHVFRVEVRDEVVAILPALPDECKDLDLHLIRHHWD